MLVIVRPPHSQDRVIRLNFLICWVRFRWRISLINDLRVIMDRRMCFTEHIDVSKALAMLGFIRRVSGEFRDPYTLKLSRIIDPWCAKSFYMRVVYGLLFMMYTSTGLSGCSESLTLLHSYLDFGW
jgi:hypothetical protein